MTRINLDNQPEAVRQFVMGLSQRRDGVILESAGQAVACLVPPPKSALDLQSAPWTNELNDRRCDLLDRKYDQGLRPPEEAELALLQDAMERSVDRVAPLPLAEARRIHQELLAKAARQAGQSD